jgi:hypothetical protein
VQNESSSDSVETLGIVKLVFEFGDAREKLKTPQAFLSYSLREELQVSERALKGGAKSLQVGQVVILPNGMNTITNEVLGQELLRIFSAQTSIPSSVRVGHPSLPSS